MLDFDAPLSKDEPIQTTFVKASARKNASTQLKINGKAANGTKSKGSAKKTQPAIIPSEKEDEKVDLKIVKKWGVFSPQSFRRASMMRVGAHGTNKCA